MIQRYPRAADLAQMHHCSACGMTNPIVEDGDTACCNKRECTGMTPDSQDACCQAMQEWLEREAANGTPPAPSRSSASAPASASRPARRRRPAAKRKGKADPEPTPAPSPQTEETQDLHSESSSANLVSHGGPEEAPTGTEEPEMAADTTHAPVTFAEDGRPVLPAGTRVTPLKDVTGRTAGEPGLTATGYVVTVQYDEEFAHLAPSGGADFAVEELKVISADEPAAETAPPAAPRKGVREALGAASAPGWELLYDKPKHNCEVGRRYEDGKPRYALICKTHGHVHELPRLTTERAVRAAGGWCPSCSR